MQNIMQSNIFFENVPKNAPKYKAVSAYVGDVSLVNAKSKRQQRTRMRKTVNDRFFGELCTVRLRSWTMNLHN